LAGCLNALASVVSAAALAKITRKAGPGEKILKLAVQGFDHLTGKVGWFASARYPNGVPVAYVALIQEMGYEEGGIPPRLGMRTTAERKQKEWGAVAKSGSVAVMHGTATPHQVMDTLGLKAAGDLRKHITEVTKPPLKQSTIDARRRKMADKKTIGLLTKPLVASGHMLATLTNETTKT
jgi:hypothetical protein